MGVSNPINQQQDTNRRQGRDRRYSDAKPWFPLVDRHGTLVQADRRQSAGRRTADQRSWRKKGNLMSLAMIATMFVVLSWSALVLWSYEHSHGIQVASDTSTPVSEPGGTQ